MKNIITIKNLYAGYPQHIVLEDINFSVDKHDFMAIIGPNGGGKTTLLKVILGLLPVISGEIQIMGKSPDEAKTYFGYVPQQRNYDWKFPVNVYDVVLTGRLKNKPLFRSFVSQHDKEIVNETLERLGIYETRKSHISLLSGGQRKRMFIARALVTEPEILILDEPTAEIDKNMEAEIYELLKEFCKTKTVILVTHDVGVISKYISKVCCLNRRMHFHDLDKVASDLVKDAYCPVDIIMPHR